MPELLKLSYMPVRGLKKVRDLEYYEGPLLSEFHSDAGATYLYSWCDEWEAGHRWMVFRVNPRDLALYTHGMISLHKLVTACEEGVIYLLDLDNEGETANVFFVPVKELPEEYLPSQDSFFMASMMPDDNKSHDVLLSEHWAFSDLRDFARKYEDLYSFLYVLGDRKHQAGLPDVCINIRAGRGHASNNLFKRIAKQVPRSDRPKIGAFHMNSPGILTIDANRDVASLMPIVIARFTKLRKTLYVLYHRLYDGRHDDKDPPGPALLRKWTLELVEALGFLDVSRLEVATGSEAEFADCVLAYYRKILALVTYETRNKAEIL